MFVSYTKGGACFPRPIFLVKTQHAYIGARRYHALLVTPTWNNLALIALLHTSVLRITSREKIMQHANVERLSGTLEQRISGDYACLVYADYQSSTAAAAAS